MNTAIARAAVGTQRGIAAEVLATAARAVASVAIDGRSADVALADAETHAERRAVRAVTLGTLRWYGRCEACILPLLARPAAQLAPLLRALLITAVHQLDMSRNPPQSTVAAAVDAARLLQLGHAAGMINAILRRFLRERASIAARWADDPALRTAHPRWLVTALMQDWPEDWSAILDANNQHPPMTLRVAIDRLSRDECLELLAAAGIAARPVDWQPTALTLEAPRSATSLAQFVAGSVSVQDASAQLAATLLAPVPGERILDACAAPGNKTGALLESTRDLRVTAIDHQPSRMRQLADNLARMGRQAQLVCADLRQPATWWDGTPFDRILLDAPCSGTGVIRRHPDIKLLRRPSDITVMAEQQVALLQQCWQLLKPGGVLLYVTCSLLRAENEDVIERFRATEPCALPWALSSQRPLSWRRLIHGCQMLPGGQSGGDGFYYAGLKHAATT